MYLHWQCSVYTDTCWCPWPGLNLILVMMLALCTVISSDDGIDLPQKVLFPPERLNLKWTQVHRIGAGLQNMGNTCFLNSALQCLTYTPPFANYMLTREHSKTCRLFVLLCVKDVLVQLYSHAIIITPILVIRKYLWAAFLPDSWLAHQCFVHLSLTQVTSRGSVWCAPCKTTSFRFLRTLGMSLSPLVCSMSSKVSVCRAKTLKLCLFY